MEELRPFLYVDLDTVVVKSLEHLIKLVVDPKQLVVLEDFWQKGHLATGLVWVPAGSSQVRAVWDKFEKPTGPRMDSYLRTVLGDRVSFWQQLTRTIYDFKPKSRQYLKTLPGDASLVCFHGHPRVYEAQHIAWVKKYIQSPILPPMVEKKVTVIIPYNRDRGWLKDAVASVPPEAQLILSQGEGNWPENFNKALSKATGQYIRWLHEDDMLTSNCIKDSVRAIEQQGADFIHGKAYEISGDHPEKPPRVFVPRYPHPVWRNLMVRNTIHSATLMYRREVFEKVGLMNERLNAMEEYEFNLRCLKAGLKIGYCDSFLAYYRRHSQQKIRTVPTRDRIREKNEVKALYV